MKIWIVWDIDDEYANDGKLLAVYNSEEKAINHAKALDEPYHQILRAQGAVEGYPEVRKSNVAYYSHGYPKHRVSGHEVK